MMDSRLNTVIIDETRGYGFILGVRYDQPVAVVPMNIKPKSQ